MLVCMLKQAGEKLTSIRLHKHCISTVKEKTERSLSASGQKQPLSASIHNENFKDVLCYRWSSHCFSTSGEFPYSVISDGADSIALLGWGGSCNLIVVQMFLDNLPDNIKASCQTVGEWNLVCSGVSVLPV